MKELLKRDQAEVKEIMRQTDIKDPKEAIYMVISRKARLSIYKWAEKDNVIYSDIVLDGTTGEDWIDRLLEQNFKKGGHALTILCSEEFEPTVGNVEVVILKGELFSDEDRTTENILKYAKNHKLIRLNAEAACLIREKFSDEELKEIGLNLFVTMHEPIKGYDYNPKFLCSDCSGTGSWLSTRSSCSDNKWRRNDGFAFFVKPISKNRHP